MKNLQIPLFPEKLGSTVTVNELTCANQEKTEIKKVLEKITALITTQKSLVEMLEHVSQKQMYKIETLKCVMEEQYRVIETLKRELNAREHTDMHHNQQDSDGFGIYFELVDVKSECGAHF